MQDASLVLHRSLGFREVGFKFGCWLDVLMLDVQLPIRVHAPAAAPYRELT